MSPNDLTEGRWLTPDPLGGDVTNPQSLNRYAGACPERSRRVTNNPASLTDPLGLSGFDPADPCGDPVYAISDAQCQGGCRFLNPEECPPACSTLNPENSIYCDCIEYGQCGYLGGASYGDYGGGGGPITPPAGQPPLAGGGAMGNPWVSPTMPWPCSGGNLPGLAGAGAPPCFVILVETSILFWPHTPFGTWPRTGPVGPPGSIWSAQPKPAGPPQSPPAKWWEKTVMTGSCAMDPSLYPAKNGKGNPDPEASVPAHDPAGEALGPLIQFGANGVRCTTEGRIP